MKKTLGSLLVFLLILSLVTITLSATIQEIHDVSVHGIELQKSIVCQGETVAIQIGVSNLGDFSETFDLLVYAESYHVGEQEVTLDVGEETSIDFLWNTTAVPRGNYSISAQANPVPNESNFTNNYLVGGQVQLTILGDVNGDSEVDIFDAVTVSIAFDSNPEDPEWNPVADMNSDQVIDIYDIVTIAIHF